MFVEPRDHIAEIRDELRELAGDAVREVVSIWYVRQASRSEIRSVLGRMVKGPVGRLIDPRQISDFRSWLLSVELAGKATEQTLGFDPLPLLVDRHCRGLPCEAIGKARGWTRHQVVTRVEAARVALFLELASRGVTRDIHELAD